MSLKDIRSECSEVAALLQPHVDGELGDPEAQRVAEHLDGCDACRSAVNEQMWVRATLRSIERESAPQGLRLNVLAALDEADAQDAQDAATTQTPQDSAQEGSSEQPDSTATTSNVVRPSFWDRARRRSADLLRGSAVMLPAAAVAAGLFVVVRGGLEPVQNLPGEGLSTAMTQTAHPSTAPVKSPAQSQDPRMASAAELPSLSEIRPQLEFPLQVAPAAGGERVQLVGARLDQGREGGSSLGARLHYRVSQDAGRSHDIVDRQRPGGGPKPTGTLVVFRGQSYHVAHAASGAPTVHFERGGVAHLLTLEGAPANSPKTKPSAESPDFSVLLDLAHRLDAQPTP